MMMWSLVVALVGLLATVHAAPYQEYTKPIILVLDRTIGVLSSGNITNTTFQVSEACKNSTSLLIGEIKKGALWALRIIDATGKPSTGFLESGTTMPGFFTECIQTFTSSNRTSAFGGKYCLAEIFIPENKLKKKNSDEPFNIVKDSRPYVGICIPSVCSDKDVEMAIRYATHTVVEDANVTLSTCYTNENLFRYDVAAIVMTTILSFMILLAIIGTLYEIVKSLLVYNESTLKKSATSTDTIPVTTASSEILCERREPKKRCSFIEKLLLCFSMKTNGKKILEVDYVKGSIDALHGIRFISMVWIIFGHSFSFAEQWLFLRKLPGQSAINITFFSQIFANGTFAVDTFLFLSGFLMAYCTLKNIKKTGKFNVFLFYFHRYIRMTPLMMAIIGFCACILRYVSSGPRWLENTSVYDTWCKENWWTNLIYLQNFINTTNMCLSHTWYSAVDMQLFIISPIIIYSLHRGKKYGLPVISLLFAVTIGLTAYLTAAHNYPAIPYVSNIVPTDLMNEYFAAVYIKPYCRMGPYLVGILLGYMLYDLHEPITIAKHWVMTGWLVTLATMLFIIYAMWPANRGILPTVDEASAYGALARTIWGIGIAWITFACMTGYGGFVNSLLSWKALIPFSRLTYSAYLIHPVLMVIFYSTRETTFDFTVSFMIYIVIGNLVFTYFLSFFLSIVFESPIIGLEKTFLHRSR
ncbi:nose resistant to fluoxetine protein 6-like [Centruroides vittatus]|uniref:nose resistant to fluoxetine protein 6-like n=1 Tax=Centruroides vittatus TaxID=120091 RepID=UPI0035101F61